MGRDFFSWTGRFDVFDMATDRVAYTVTGKLISLRKRVIITDPSGMAVAIVQKKLIGLRKVYEIYRWTEAYPGQDEPDWSLRKPSLHALSQPGGRHAELQHMEFERRSWASRR